MLHVTFLTLLRALEVNIHLRHVNHSRYYYYYFFLLPTVLSSRGIYKIGVRKNVCFIDPHRLAKNCQMSRRTRWHCISEQWQRCVETEKPSLLVRPKMPTSGGPNKLKISPPLRWLDPRSQSRPDKTNTCVWAPGTCHSSIFAALSDAAPATKLVSAKCEWASVSGTVASQARHFPSSQLTKVHPSGRPSPERMRPTGSLVEGMPALTKALWIASFSWAWRVCLPALLRQDNPWLPLASTNAPQGQLWGEQRFAPSLRPTATRTASLSMRSPHAVMGHAWSPVPAVWTPVTQAVEPCYIDQCELSANGLDLHNWCLVPSLLLGLHPNLWDLVTMSASPSW